MITGREILWFIKIDLWTIYSITGSLLHVSNNIYIYSLIYWVLEKPEKGKNRRIINFQ